MREIRERDRYIERARKKERERERKLERKKQTVQPFKDNQRGGENDIFVNEIQNKQFEKIIEINQQIFIVELLVPL